MNKRNLLLVIVFCLSVGITKAQDQKFHFGLKVAPTLAWLKPDSKELTRDGSKLGFSYGIIGEYNFSSNYAIASGVQVTYRGGSLNKKNPLNTKDSVSKWNLQYVELPISIKMKTKEFNKFRYFGQFGFVPGVNLKAKADTDLESDIDSKANVRTMNVSMLVAIGTEYTISGSTTFLASFEFNNGFVDVLKTKKANDTGVILPGNNNVISNYFALNIGVMF